MILNLDRQLLTIILIYILNHFKHFRIELKSNFEA